MVFCVRTAGQEAWQGEASVEENAIGCAHNETLGVQHERVRSAEVKRARPDTNILSQEPKLEDALTYF